VRRVLPVKARQSLILRSHVRRGQSGDTVFGWATGEELVCRNLKVVEIELLQRPARTAYVSR